MTEMYGARKYREHSKCVSVDNPLRAVLMRCSRKGRKDVESHHAESQEDNNDDGECAFHT